MTIQSASESQSHRVSAFTIEYITQSLFKGKTLASAARSFHRKFNGKDNLFLGRVDHTIDELIRAVLEDKVRDVLQAARRMNPGNALMALKGSCARFNLDEPQLAAAVEAHLAAQFPGIEVIGTSPSERAVSLMNAVCCRPAPAHNPMPEDPCEGDAPSQDVPRG